MTTIVWFRQDLRLQDNPALAHGAQMGAVLPIYILDDETPGQWKRGGASRWWLHHSLVALDKSLQAYGHRLHVFQGNPAAVIAQIQQHLEISEIVWNRCYEPFHIERDKALRQTWINQGLQVASFNANLMFEPWTITNKEGSYFKVFTPFWKHCLTQDPGPMVNTDNILAGITAIQGNLPSISIDDLKLLPTQPNWAVGFEPEWTPGEAGAMAAFNSFQTDAIENYKEARDFMDQKGTSRLSPHLHFGEISPRYLWHACHELLATHQGNTRGIQHFLSELGWREFSYHLMYHVPEFDHHPFRKEFGQFPWSDNTDVLHRWQKGQTGIPVVDAAMRELWHTGYMHNRARMIVASFLTKNCLIPWQRGAEWFWDTLVDADLANNSAGWQWVAGCGADAAPYFRIFNPVTQSQTFDPKGEYIKRWVPELKHLESEALYAPWEATPEQLIGAGVVLGKTYPYPIVDLKESRAAALAAYQAMKGTNV